MHRFLHSPSAYLFAMMYRLLLYPVRRIPWKLKRTLFFGEKLQIALPASTDIYLTAAKSHDSEIRLARYLIRTLHEGDHFVDIGAHVGYFSVLASSLVGTKGRVIACEPAMETYELLSENARGKSNLLALKTAVSDHVGEMSFYEFSSSHSEYNSGDITQYAATDWLKNNAPQKRCIPCVTIDYLCTQQQINPHIIKIDVEGGESQVIRGALSCLTAHHPAIVMEYHPASRNLAAHNLASDLLLEAGYRCHQIDAAGELKVIGHPSVYFRGSNTDSDNLVFARHESAS